MVNFDSVLIYTFEIENAMKLYIFVFGSLKLKMYNRNDIERNQKLMRMRFLHDCIEKSVVRLEQNRIL